MKQLKLQGKLITLSMVLFVLIQMRATAQMCERLVWQDEFDGPNLDLNKWGYETGDGCPNLCQWGTGQLDYSTNRTENVRIENGKLVLELRKEAVPNNFNNREYTSGRIRTYQKVNFRYGRLEARVKGVYSQGLGFAFWLLGSSFEKVSWPKCGEVDIFEQTGKFPDYNIGTTHYQEAWGHAWNQGKFYLPGGQRFADAFHTVGLEWTPDSMRWYIDGTYYHTFYYSEPINGYDPFNRDFFIILSVGMGGDYSGAPDGTTVLPQKAEIEYVRVYEGAYSMYVDGDKKVWESERNKEYSTKAIIGASYNWTVPAGATIASGQGTNKIVVNWGSTSGEVKVRVTESCGAYDVKTKVTVEPAFITNIIYDDFETNRNCTYGYLGGVFTQGAANPGSSTVNSSTRVGKYVRNSSLQWDAIVMENVNPGHAGEFVQKKKRLLLDVYTDAPVGTKISLGFENSLVATPEQPYGKHSNYIGYTSKQNQWETIELEYSDSPDKYAGAYKVNKFVMMFDPGIYSGNTYYFDNLRSGQSGPDAPILNTAMLHNFDGIANINLVKNIGSYQPNTPNPSASGVNTSATVLKYTRNAAQNYDNIAYSIKLDDASLFKEGTNTLAFDVYTNAPAGKVVSVHFEDSTISAANDWQAPIHSIYEGKVTKQNQWETIEFKWSSTPNAAVTNVNINKLVFLIDENTNNGDVYYIDNIRINSRKIPESFVLSKTLENYENNRFLEWIYSADSYQAAIANPAAGGNNSSTLVGKYTRSTVNPNDWLVFNLKTTIDADALRKKTKVFAMDVYTNAPVGKLITIGLEASALATATNWPTGRHSDYAGVVKAQNQWHTVQFIYSSSADASTPADFVNKLIVTTNQGEASNYVYYFDNIRILESVKEPVLAKIEVTPVLTENVAINGTVQYTAVGKDQFGNTFPSTITWSVSGGGTITSAGRFTATANGVWKVYATSGSIRGEADVLVGQGIRLSRIVVNPTTATIYQNNSVQLSATGYDQLNRVYNIAPTWSSSNTAVATVSASGLVTGIAPGTATITVSQSGISATSTITVRATPVLTTITINPVASKIFLNQTQQFTATTKDQYGDPITAILTWTATGATITTGGLFSASAIGTYPVKVQSGELADVTYITVLQTPSNIAQGKPIIASTEENYGTIATYANDGDATTRWSSVNADPQWIRVDLGAVYNISSVVLNWETAAGKAYTIQTSNTDNNDYITVATETNGSSGVKTYNLNVSARYVRVYGTARATTYGYSLYEFQVFGVPVATPALKSIIVEPGYKVINQGTTQQYTAKQFDQFGNSMSQAITWSVNGGSINTSGLYSASAGGTFKVTATSGSISGSADVVVKQNNVLPTVSITAPAANAVFAPNSNITVSANAADADGTISLVEFFEGANKIGEDATSPYSISWNNVTSRTYSLTAKATDNKGGATTSTAVSIRVNTLPTVSITSPANNASYASGSTVTVTATAADADGTVSQVEFLADGVSRGTDNTAPYSINITGLSVGTHTLTAKATDNNSGVTTSSSISIVITSVNPNLALNKPATASSVLGGNVATAANDGNATGTRWESVHGVDPQWITVDLQATYTINQVILKWETASGKNYTIQTSTDNTNWTTIKTVTNGPGGTETLAVSGSGRYIRTYGTARNTGWGYSLWEFEVYGNSGGNIAPTANAGADKAITLPTNSVVFNGTGTDSDGSIASYAWSQVSGPSTATLSGQATANLTASALIAGTYVFRLTVTDNAGATGTDDAQVVVNPQPSANIALNKPATASGVLGGNVATAANDGNVTGTRWESVHGIDPQWITIDLQATYTITQVILKWETASGKNYTIQTSTDNTNWTTIKTVTNGPGGTETLAVSGSGRYIRMYGTARNTMWGYSLWEFEVYGTAAKSGAIENTPASDAHVSYFPNPVVDQLTVRFAADANYHTLKVIDLSGKTISTLRIAKGSKSVDVNMVALRSGSYILNLSGDADNRNFIIVKR